MPYVKRDVTGKVVAVTQEPEPGAPIEFLEPDAEELRAFVTGTDDSTDLQRRLSESDNDMVRVVEDLIEILIDKNVILLTDLPAPAQRKLMARRQMRGGLADLSDLVKDELDI